MMKVNKKPFPLRSIETVRERINTNPDFQRPAVWGLGQKQLLVDTVLRDYDVPKLNWRRTGTKPDRYDVVDGQQRLRTIFEFFDGKFSMAKGTEAIDDHEVAGCSYKELPDDLRIKFDNYALDVVILEETDEDEVREMFLRLQNGTSLKAQEKRNAMPGEMRTFVKDIAQHPFFDRVEFSNSRFTFDLVAAQLICIELAGGPTNVKNRDLNVMYEKHRLFDPKGVDAKSVRRVLKVLAEVFPEKTPELERYNVIALYCVVSELLKGYVIDEIKDKLHGWFVAFETERHSAEAVPQDDADAEWVSYKEKISHSTDSAESIRFRMEFMLRRLLQSFPTLSTKDNQREFTHVQKLAVFRRDLGACQLKLTCEGQKITWDAWHCDHHVPWSKGGKTTVENGRVARPPCNLAKGGEHPSAPG